MTDAQKLVQQVRGVERGRVLLGATVVSPEGSHAVRVRDLSRGGAQVVCDTALPTEVDAIFKRDGVFAAARIVWSRNNEAGLKFYRELD